MYIIGLDGTRSPDGSHASRSCQANGTQPSDELMGPQDALQYRIPGRNAAERRMTKTRPIALFTLALALMAALSSGCSKEKTPSTPGSVATSVDTEPVGTQPVSTQPVSTEAVSLTATPLASLGANFFAPGTDRIQVPAIGVDAPLTVRIVGLDGNMRSPKTPDDVAIYQFSKWPRYGGSFGVDNVVLAGFVDNSRPCRGEIAPPCKAIFWELGNLSLGDSISIDWQGVTFGFSVTSVCWAQFGPLGQDFNDVVAAGDDSQITLMTDAGRLEGGRNSHKLLITALEGSSAEAKECAVGLPHAPDFSDEIEATRTPVPPADVSIVSVESTIAIGRQFRLLAQTDANASCTVRLYDGRPIAQYSSRHETADDDGLVFFERVIPTNIHPGAGSIEVDCGTAPATANITFGPYIDGLDLTPGYSRIGVRGSLSAEIVTVEVAGADLVFEIVQTGVGDRSRLKFSCLVDLETGDKQSAWVYESTGENSARVLFPESYLEEGGSYGFVHGCHPRATVAPLELD